MSISSAVDASLSGLRATQAGINVVSQNVANSGTVGYTKRVLVTTQEVAGGQTLGVNVVGAQRVLDTLIQKQLRLETAGSSYTGVKAGIQTSLETAFDPQGGTGALPTLLSTFTSSLQTLATDPSSYTARSGVVAAASTLAGSLNDLSDQVQTLRQNAEDGLSNAVSQANSILTNIAQIAAHMNADPSGATSAALQDQRDGLIDQLSELMDVKVDTQTNGTTRITTTSGLQLFDGVSATKLTFDAHSAIGPQSVYSSDPSKRSVGTITANGTDVVAAGLIRSGSIAAYLDMRDDVLPQAQTQLDALAAGLSSSLSDKSVTSAAATSGGASGFDIDLSSLSSGNPINLTVATASGSKTFTFIKAGSASGAAAATASGAGIGIDFSGGMSSVASQIGTALGASFAVSNPSGSVLRVLDDGAAGTTDVTSLGATSTLTGLSSGDVGLPLFTDGGQVYSGSYDGGSQFVGLAGRITLNASVKSDNSKLVTYSASTLSGDSTRPRLIYDTLTGTDLTFTGKAGIGGSAAPFVGTLGEYTTQVLTTQANASTAATSLDAGQKVVLNAVQSRYSDSAGVNIDSEMTQLIQLQTAYSANARVMTAAKQMLDTLMAVGS